MKKYLLFVFLLLATALKAQNVPDANFRNVLASIYSITCDGSNNIIDPTAAAGITDMDVNSQNISDLTGIEAFTGLTRLVCNYNTLTSLNVSSNIALATLYCDNNTLTSLTLPASTSLTFLDCSDNVNLTSLNVSSYSALATLYCSNCGLTSLTLPTGASLTDLYCPNNALTSLDVTTNTALTSLYCDNNPALTTLDVHFNTALITLGCGYNSMPSLDVSANTALTTLYCNNNALTTLDVHFNTALTFLDCEYNGTLTSLDAHLNTALTTLYCNNSALTVLTLPASTALTTLFCSNNALINLDVSSNTALTDLRCNSNSLTGLNVSSNTALTKLWCLNNPLTTLNVSSNTALQELDCSNNSLTSLNVSLNTALISLFCFSNTLTGLNVSSNLALTTLFCHNNTLTGLNVSANPALNNLICYNNRIPIIYTNGSGLFISKDAFAQVATFRSASASPSIPGGQTGGFTLSGIGANVNLTTNTGGAGSLAASSGTNPTIFGALPAGTTNISPDKYWTISGSNLTGTYNVILDLTGITNIASFNTLQVLKRNDASSAWQNVADAPISATVEYLQPFIIVSGLTSFSDFAIGSNGDNTLPVTLSVFSGSSNNEKAQLNWKTQSEENNAGFVVLRDGNAIASYQTNPSLRGAGTTSSANNYSFTDQNVEVNKSYTYKLRSIDLNGTIHDYPKVVSVKVEANKANKVYEYELKQNYPNPFNPTTTIQFTMKQAGVAKIRVFDMLGRVVLSESIQATVGDNNFYKFNGATLGSGVYIYELQAGNFTFTRKMLLVK